MGPARFSWRDPQFTYADALTGSRLVMLPFMFYALARRLPDLAVGTLAAMIATDLVDGRVARRLGQSRAFGGAFDSTVDFVVIYGLFTALFVVGTLPWWKWLVIIAPAVLMAWTQIMSVRRADEVVLAPAPVAKLVGQIQFAYLPFLILRTFWLQADWARVVDHVVFGILAVAIVFNTLDYVGTLRRLLGTPGGSSAGR